MAVLWTQLLSIFSSLICMGIVLRKYPASHTDIKYLSLAALSVWLLGDLSYSIQFSFQEYLNVILQSLALSFLLIIFLIFIRKMKPVIFRYPYYMVFIPLLIPLAQIIVIDTPMMRDIFFMSLEGVSILVFSLLCGIYTSEISTKLITLSGIILLIGGFTFFWILQDHFVIFEWSWAFTNSLGVIASVYSFTDLLNMNETR